MSTKSGTIEIDFTIKYFQNTPISHNIKQNLCEKMLLLVFKIILWLYFIDY